MIGMASKEEKEKKLFEFSPVTMVSAGINATPVALATLGAAGQAAVHSMSAKDIVNRPGLVGAGAVIAGSMARSTDIREDEKKTDRLLTDIARAEMGAQVRGLETEAMTAVRKHMEEKKALEAKEKMLGQEKKDKLFRSADKQRTQEMRKSRKEALKQHRRDLEDWREGGKKGRKPKLKSTYSRVPVPGEVTLARADKAARGSPTRMALTKAKDVVTKGTGKVSIGSVSKAAGKAGLFTVGQAGNMAKGYLIDVVGKKAAEELLKSDLGVDMMQNLPGVDATEEEIRGHVDDFIGEMDGQNVIIQMAGAPVQATVAAEGAVQKLEQQNIEQGLHGEGFGSRSGFVYDTLSEEYNPVVGGVAATVVGAGEAVTHTAKIASKPFIWAKRKLS